MTKRKDTPKPRTARPPVKSPDVGPSSDASAAARGDASSPDPRDANDTPLPDSGGQ